AGFPPRAHAHILRRNPRGRLIFHVAAAQAHGRQRKAHYEVEDHYDFGVAEVVVYEAARDEACEAAECAEEKAALDPVVESPPAQGAQERASVDEEPSGPDEERGQSALECYLQG